MKYFEKLKRKLFNNYINKYLDKNLNNIVNKYELLNISYKSHLIRRDNLDNTKIIDLNEKEKEFINRYIGNIINDNCGVVNISSIYYINIIKIPDDYYIIAVHKLNFSSEEDYLFNRISLQYICLCDQFYEVKKLIKELHIY